MELAEEHRGIQFKLGLFKFNVFPWPAKSRAQGQAAAEKNKVGPGANAGLIISLRSGLITVSWQPRERFSANLRQSVLLANILPKASRGSIVMHLRG